MSSMKVAIFDENEFGTIVESPMFRVEQLPPARYVLTHQSGTYSVHTEVFYNGEASFQNSEHYKYDLDVQGQRNIAFTCAYHLYTTFVMQKLRNAILEN